VETWHRKLVAADVQFAVRDYREIASGPGDLLYLDPPYRTSARYYGRIGYSELFGWLGSQQGNYLLSLNGHVGGEDRTLSVPGDLYDEHIQVEAGDMRFLRLSGKTRTAVSDSLYIRRTEDWKQQPTPDVDPTRMALGRPKSRARSECMSVAIRSLLDADPTIKPAEVKRRLGEKGMSVSSPLFRVVRLNWRRAKMGPFKAKPE
jgi:hypothetical protein